MIDTRNIKEIFQCLTVPERKELAMKVLRETKISDCTWRTWRLMTRTPGWTNQKIVASAIKALGYDVRPEFLFPSK